MGDLPFHVLQAYVTMSSQDENVLLSLWKSIIFPRRTEASSSVIKSRKETDTKLDYSHINVELRTVDGLVKERTQCAPNGYYYIPVPDGDGLISVVCVQGSFVIKISGPEGWSWDPDKVPVVIDDNGCNNNEDINIRFTGFALSGRVVGAVGGQSCLVKNGGPANVNADLLSPHGDLISSELTMLDGRYLFKNIIPVMVCGFCESKQTKAVFSIKFLCMDSNKIIYLHILEGKYNLHASSSDLKIEVRDSTEVELGFQNGVVEDIFFVAGYDIHGSVFAQGSPIFGVHIYVYSDDVIEVDCPQGSDTAPEQRKALCHAVSDADWLFTFKSVPSGLYLEGSVSPPIFSVHIQIIAGDVSMIASFKKGVVLETATEADGSFVAGALYDDITYNVKASKDDATEPSPSVLLSLSGDDGYRNNSLSGIGGIFVSENLFPGSFYLRPLLKEYAFSSSAQAIELGFLESRVVVFHTTRVAYSAMDVVTLLTGQPKEGVFIEARSESRGYYEDTVTDSSGSYRLRGLIPDSLYLIKVVKKNGLGSAKIERASPVSVPVKVGNNDIKGLDFLVFEEPEMTIVTGHVEVNRTGELPSHLLVEIKSAGDTYKIESVFPLPLSNFFQVKDLPRGKHTVQLKSNLHSNTYKFESDIIEVDLQKKSQVHELTPAPVFPLIVGVSVIILFLSIPRLKDLYQAATGIPTPGFMTTAKKEVRKPVKFFSASLTLRNKVSLATTIASKLSTAQRKLFEEACFGPWLRVQHPGGDASLTHLWLQTMTSDLPDSIQRGEEEIWFHFPPAYTCFGRKEFCLITGLRFGHDDVGRYTRHITRPSWLSRVFPDESIEKPNLHVDDMNKLFNKKDGFSRMNDVDVVRVCLLLLLYAGFLGREARQPIPQELILLVEDLNAWNLFPWGSYIWKATWTKLSSAFDDRKSLRGDGSKYTLSDFVWAFKIWIFEAFPSMRTYALKSSDDIPRAISWKRKRMLNWEDLIPYATINNEANTPLMRLTPTEAELATDWWQASQHFFDGTNDEQPPLSPLREPSPHPEPSPDRPDYTPLQREPSPIPSHHRVSSPPSPHDRRPTKMPRLLSPCSPPPRDESRELRDEVNALREEIGTLRDNDGAWRVEVSTLRGEVAALHEMVVSLQNEVHTLRNESSRIRRRARAIKSPYTPIVRRHRKKKPDSPIIPQESTPIIEEAPIIPRESPPTVQEATVIVEEVPPTIQEPDSHGVICRIIEKPSDVPDMMDSSWLSYELPASTIPVSEEERKQLPDTILDNTLWAKTAVDFYLHERSQGCFTDICKLNDDIYLLLDRSWWGVLLGVEDNGYFDGGNQRDESFALGNGQAKLYPAWWEVDKVFIPVLERNHWLLVELQIPSLKAIVYDSMINYISLADLRDIIKGWSSYLAKYLDAINYWTRSGNKKPNKLNITVSRDETAPQQTKGPRGDCGPLVCLALDRLITGSIKYLPPTDIDRAAVGLWFRHYMARSIYTRRCLPASAL
ncbi:S uncoupled 1 [Hibiscus syriacus]|uniref:S uncoupled 1 n=1 Tax=Hibiscus syriacus TaxID=106335 RepID=A0A6A2Z022_HIBSY|nr:S uncoupled 1 [Hibiscus syriacus]